MPFTFSDLLFVVTTGVLADRLWDALLHDLPSVDLMTNWIRAILFVGVFTMLAAPYLVTRTYLAPKLFKWLRRCMSRRRPYCLRYLGDAQGGKRF